MKKRALTAILLAVAISLVPMNGPIPYVQAAQETQETETEAAPESEQETETAPESEQGTEAAPESEQETETAPESEQGTETAPESEQETETVPEGERESEIVPEEEQEPETAEKIQLDAPTEPEWGENYIAKWKKGENQKEYQIQIYKDELEFQNVWLSIEENKEAEIQLYRWINANGTYKFRVRSIAPYDSTVYVDSEWSEWSSEKTYVRPDRALETIVPFCSGDGIFSYETVQNAAGYEWELYFLPNDGDSELCVMSGYPGAFGTVGELQTYDFNSDIERYGNGRYRFRVRALSGALDEIANGEFGDFATYFTYNSTGSVRERLTEIVDKAETKAEALQQVKSSIDKDALKKAMQSDNSVYQKVYSLEGEYVEEQGIRSLNPTVSAEAGSYLKAEDLSAAGVGLNAEKGDTVQLEISVPEKKEDVSDSPYKENVQLDIQLKRNGESVHELDIPVAVTMPIPGGLSPETLVIRHYNADGTYETLDKKDNGDGTVTFMVSSLSTFVFLGKIALPTPTELSWGKNFEANYTGVGDDERYYGEGYYEIEIYRNGEYYCHAWGAYPIEEWSSKNTSNETTTMNIDESGTYKFRVRAMAFGDSAFASSAWSEWSEERVYVKPDKVLGTTVAYPSESEEGVFLHKTVPGAGAYLIEIYYTASGSNTETCCCSTIMNAYDDSVEIMRENLSFAIEEYGAGKYRIRIRAISNNLDEIANGEFGEFSQYYDTEVGTQSVKDKLSDAIGNAATNEEALQQVKDTIEKESLKLAMQTDEDTLQAMSALEEAYVEEQGIQVEKPAVSEGAEAYVKAEDISMVGAGLNAAEGDTLQLEVSVPEKKEIVPGTYSKKSVQLDIELKRNGESVHELEIPITITLPIPEGLDINRLVILHYHEDGSYETVNPKNNGDGTLTFTITRFSTFVFAEETTSESSGQGSNQNSSESLTNGADKTVSTAPTENVTSPKTGGEMEGLQSGIFCLAMSVFVVTSFLLAAESKKRRGQKKS